MYIVQVIQMHAVSCKNSYLLPNWKQKTIVVVVCYKALQSLGCSHVLETYLQGLTVKGFANVDSVREIQYEAAIQNCKWDLELATR